MGFGKGKNGRFVCTTAPLFFRRSHACETLLFALAILDYAPSGFRPLMFFSLQTLCFFERARRFAATDGNPLFFRASATFSCLCRKTIAFSGERNVFLPPAFRSFSFRDPLVFISFQGAAAAAAGRGSPPPPRAGVASLWVDICKCFLWL